MSDENAIVQYGDWTPEQIKEDGKQMDSGGDYWKVPVGTTAVRLLPPKLGWKSPFVIRHQHFIRMPGVEKPIIFCCPREHESKQCVPCARADKLETSGNKRDAGMAKNLRPRKGVLANVVVNPKDETSKVQLWTFGTTVFNQLKSIRENDESGGNFLDPKTGFNIVVKRVGSGKDDTEYTLMPARNQTPLANMAWIDQQRDPRKLIRIPTVEQQERLLAGEDPKDVWGDDDGARPDGDQTQRKGKGRVIDADSTDGKRTAEDDLFDDEVDLD
jgi:gp32 DNA binding protein like